MGGVRPYRASSFSLSRRCLPAFCGALHSAHHPHPPLPPPLRFRPTAPAWHGLSLVSTIFPTKCADGRLSPLSSPLPRPPPGTKRGPRRRAVYLEGDARETQKKGSKGSGRRQGRPLRNQKRRNGCTGIIGWVGPTILGPCAVICHTQCLVVVCVVSAIVAPMAHLPHARALSHSGYPSTPPTPTASAFPFSVCLVVSGVAAYSFFFFATHNVVDFFFFGSFGRRTTACPTLHHPSTDLSRYREGGRGGGDGGDTRHVHSHSTPPHQKRRRRRRKSGGTRPPVVSPHHDHEWWGPSPSSSSSAAFSPSQLCLIPLFAWTGGESGKFTSLLLPYLHQSLSLVRRWGRGAAKQCGQQQ